MDYKTHIFNAALEGNLMGLKVRTAFLEKDTWLDYLLVGHRLLYIVALPTTVSTDKSTICPPSKHHMTCFSYNSAVMGEEENFKVPFNINCIEGQLLLDNQRHFIATRIFINNYLRRLCPVS